MAGRPLINGLRGSDSVDIMEFSRDRARSGALPGSQSGWWTNTGNRPASQPDASQPPRRVGVRQLPLGPGPRSVEFDI